MAIIGSINIGGVTIESDGSILIFGFAPTFAGAKFGSATDYTQFEADGTMVAAGAATVYRDQLGDAVSISSNGPGVALNAAENTQDFAHNATYNATIALADYLYANYQLNHDRKDNSTIYPHIHWEQEKDYSPNFLLAYRWQVNGGTKTTAWTLLKCNSLAFTYVSGTLNQISKTAAGIAIPGGGDGISDVLELRIFRDTTGASSEYTGTTCPYNTGGNATARVTAIDVHYEVDTLGSRTEYSK